MCHSNRAGEKFLYINTALPRHTKVWNSAYDNLYSSKNERWCSLHCFQYNAMYQTAKGYEVYEASPSQQITYWFRNGSIAICNFWIWMQIWNVIKSDSSDKRLLLYVCRHKLNLPLLLAFATWWFHIVPWAWYCLIVIQVLSNQTGEWMMIGFTDCVLVVIKHELHRNLKYWNLSLAASWHKKTSLRYAVHCFVHIQHYRHSLIDYFVLRG